MTAAGLQLQLVGLDARRDDLSAGEREAVEQTIRHDDVVRALHALAAQRCRCGPRAYGEDQRCVKCGRPATTERTTT